MNVKTLRAAIALVALSLGLVPGLAGGLAAQDLPARMTVESHFEPALARPGDKVTLVIKGEIEPGYHLYGSKQADGGAPTLEVDKATQKLLQASGAFQVPPGKLHLDPEFPGLQSYWIFDEATFKQTFTVAKDAKPGELVFQGSVTYTACTEEQCDPPFAQKLAPKLKVLEGTAKESGPGAKPPAGKNDGQDPVLQENHRGRHQSMDVVLVPAKARAGEIVIVEVHVAMDDGWHNYGSGQDAKLGYPATLEAGDDKWKAVGAPETPEGEPHEIAGVAGTFYFLEGEWVMRHRFRVPEGTKPGEFQIPVEVQYTACNDSFCEDLVKVGMGSTLTVEAGAARAEFLKEPAKPDPAQQDPSGDDSSDDGLFLFILSAIGAGLFALVMPCTYPMIPITVSFFTKQAEERGGHVLPLALLYGAGIVLSFVIVAFVVGLAAVDMQAFGVNPWVNLALGSLFVIFAFSLLGLINLQPPQFMMNAAGKASAVGGPIGVFLMGMTLCISSFTCTAPVLGAILAAGTHTGDLGRLTLGLAVFGLTMATPFVILSIVPSKLPRSGGWMNSAKVMFAFIELAAALKFFSIMEISWHWRILPREVFLGLWSALFFVAGLYMLGLVKLKGETGEIGGGRLMTGTAVIALAFYCLVGSMGYSYGNFLMGALEPPYTARIVGDARGGGSGNAQRGHIIIENDFDKAVRVAQAEDKLLLLNFTGYA